MIRLPHFPEIARDLEGLPVTSAREERVARVVTWIASVWFALAAGWELFGPILAGHYAAMGGMGIIAENMLRWHIPGPVWEYTTSRPTPAMYYCHHPWGTFWTTALGMRIFGRHDFVCRLPAVVLSAATPPLLFAIGRAVWRPAAGAAAAAAFVVLPITLAFANFNVLEVPVMAWSLLGAWGLVRMTQTGRRRHLAAALAGSLLSLQMDWPAYVFVGAMLGFGFARGFLVTGLFGPLRHPRRYAQWWTFTAIGSALTLALYLAVFKADGKLDDLLGAGNMRSSGAPQVATGSFAAELQRALDGRRYWIELSFSPIAIAIGKVGALVCALRLLILRREHEFLAIAFLVMATFQYVVFKQGADIHVFWPQYFGAYFALAVGALVATLTPALERAAAMGRSHQASKQLAGREPPPSGESPKPPPPALVALGVMLVPLLAIFRDGLPALRYARATGGRFNEKGVLIQSDGAKTAFLEHILPTIAPDATVHMHDGMRHTWAQTWALGGRLVATNRPVPQRPHPTNDLYVADARFLPSDAQGALARDFHVVATGPFWKVAEAEGPAPIDAFSFVETEPSIFEWYFLNGTEPHREIVADPWATWELRTHFGQPADPPAGAPVTLAEQRIAHNIAVAAGNLERAAELRASIERELTPLHVRFDDGTELVGTTFVDGAAPCLTLYVLAGGPLDAQIHVTSKVLESASWSTTMADPTEREVGLPLALPATRWRRGFLYADPIAIVKRPGTEVYRASLVGRGAPRLPAGKRDVDLLTLH